jgi:integrase
MRQGEILSLTWKQINKEKALATLEETKNGERRVVPLAPSALAVLEALPRTLRGPVFVTSTEALVQSWKRAVVRARRVYLADCKKQGVEEDPDFLADLHFHDLRHEAISRLFEMGLDAMTVSEISGHKTLSQLKRYTHLSKQDVAQRLAQLEVLRKSAI